MYIPRHIQPLLQRIRRQFPALLLSGARQVGKSTLLQHIGADYRYLTLDDPLLLTQAQDDPRLFFLNNTGNLILDEVQYAPELFPLLKLEIDKQKQNGQYMLSGSQTFPLMQNVSESLAGRIAILQLTGLSQREIRHINFYRPFIPDDDYLTAREAMLVPYDDIWQHIHRGDMPRLYEQETNWDIYYASYVATYIERDVRQLANIGAGSDFTRFMAAVAARSGELLNYTNLAQDAGISADTAKRWLTILQAANIIYLLPPYSHNHLKRAIKTPKLYLLNTGLMAWLSRWLTPETIAQGAKSGQFFETFIVSEIIKTFRNNGLEPPLYYYRDTNQKEIDLIIEHNQTLYPLEIKTTAGPNKKMAAAFAILRNNLTDIRIHKGIIISQYPQKWYLAEDVISLPPMYI